MSIRKTFNFESSGHGLQLEQLVHLNRFYKRPDIRRIVYDLYKGVCQATGKPVLFEQAHVGHIVPKAKASLFEELYPGLDVDNLVNLHLIGSTQNLKTSDYFVVSPLAIHNAISYSARLISQRLDKVIKVKKGYLASSFEETMVNIGIETFYDFSEIYNWAFDRDGYHALPLEDVESVIAKVAEENKSKGLTYADISYVFANHMICKGYREKNTWGAPGYISFGQYRCNENSQNMGDPAWAINAKHDLDIDPARRVNLPDGEWLILEGKKENAPTCYIFRSYLEEEWNFGNVAWMYFKVKEIQRTSCSTNRHFIEDADWQLDDIDYYAAKLEKRGIAKISVPSHISVKDNKICEGDTSIEKEVCNKRGLYLLGEGRKFSGQVFRAEELSDFEDKLRVLLKKISTKLPARSGADISRDETRTSPALGR